MQMRLLEITPLHERLFADAWKELREWRKFLVGIDGIDGVGKSTLARFLAWQMGISNIENDLLLDSKKPGFNYREDDLRRLIEARLNKNRPVIVEGVFLLKILDNLKLEPNYLIWVENRSREGSHTLQNEFAKYDEDYKPRTRANFVFSRNED